MPDATLVAGIAGRKRSAYAYRQPVSAHTRGYLYGIARNRIGVSWAIATRNPELTPAEIHKQAAKAFASGHPMGRRQFAIIGPWPLSDRLNMPMPVPKSGRFMTIS